MSFIFYDLPESKPWYPLLITVDASAALSGPMLGIMVLGKMEGILSKPGYRSLTIASAHSVSFISWQLDLAYSFSWWDKTFFSTSLIDP